MLKLNETQTRSLLAQPETGMGYQEVEATLRDNRTEKGIVYNAELIFLGTESRNILKLSSYPTVLKAARSAGDEIKSLRVLRTREGTMSLSAGMRDPCADTDYSRRARCRNGAKKSANETPSARASWPTAVIPMSRSPRSTLPT